MKNATKNVRCVTPHTPLGALAQRRGLLRQRVNGHQRTVSAPLAQKSCNIVQSVRMTHILVAAGY